jgi:nucleoside-diphosphate-sugar epimerase
MNALVTGATGFIGGALVRRLAGQGWTVRCLVRPARDVAERTACGVSVARGDILNTDSLRGAVAGVDVVFHLAGATRAARRAHFFRINADGTRNLVQAMRLAGTAEQVLVHVSSLAAGGPCGQEPGLTEDLAGAPVSDYGRSKLAGEQAALAARAQRPVSVIRPPIVYGPADRAMLPLFRCVARGVIPLPGSVDRRFSLIFIEDLVEGLALAADRARSGGGVFYLTGTPAHSWREIGEAIAAAMGKRATAVRIPDAAMATAAWVASAWCALTGRKPGLLNADKWREARQAGWLCSGARAERELGFRPRVRLDEGVKLSAEWYKRQGWL